MTWDDKLFFLDNDMLPRITPNETLKKNYQNYLQALNKTLFSGEISTDYANRLTVATDNSIYQVIPQAVIFPRHTQDICILLKLSQQPEFRDIQFAPRGGGTSTNGQSLSAGIIIDCSKYMREVLEINVEKNWVRVQPGVVLDQLNLALKPWGVHFAPEISPSNRATLGGMINTDACGNGSKVLGRTSDHVVDLTCVLVNGDVIQTSDSSGPKEQQLTTWLTEHNDLIKEKFFNAPRTLSGYNLAKAYQEKLNLNYLLCGSEGTLGIISECKLKLSPLPAFKKLVVIKYENFLDALNAREIGGNIHPLVIETIDEKLIALAEQDSIYFYIKEFIQDARSINLVEFVGNDLSEIDRQIAELCLNVTNSPYALGFYVAKNAEEIKLLWELRKKSVGLISKRLDGTRRPIPFIEDTAVPPEKLADYIAEFKNLLDKHQLIYGMYGHIDAGCIHVRPALDMRLSQDEKLMRELSDEVVALVKKYNGVMWGEHGKGFRSEYGPAFFGETLYQVVRQIKTLFDPYNQLNPGKIAVPLDYDGTLVDISNSLRGQFDKTISVEKNAIFSGAVSCNGNGACFNFATQDVMCPSYKATQDRVQSPKGRATVLREWLRQLTQKNYSLTSQPRFNFPVKILNYFKKSSDFSHEVYNALSSCLGCKACTSQCPLNVDIPDLRGKFLAHYYSRYPRKLRDYLIGHTEKISQWQSRFSFISNVITQNSLSRFLVKHCFQLVDLPRIDTTRWARCALPTLPLPQKKRRVGKAQYAPQALPPNSIILIQDALTSFYDKKVLIASYHFFTSLGLTVYIAPFFPSGKPLQVKGFLNSFSKIAKKNIGYLREIAQLGAPLIGLDPSMTLTYRDEYQKLLGNESLEFEVLLPQEFLQKQITQLPRIKQSKNYYLLSHCTEKTLQVEAEKQWQTIFSAMGLVLTPLAVGCCGMAGAYGHEKEQLNNSYKLFNMDWERQITAHSQQENVLLVTGYSCRSQAKRINHVTLMHPLEALYKELS